MKLVIDIGNTKTKAALFVNGKIFFEGKSGDDDIEFIKTVLTKGKIDSAILSSVKKENAAINELLESKNIKFLELTASTPLPFKNLYKTPETLGKDRIALAAAASALFPGENVLVIDAGTSITYDFINSRNEYLGGAIAPGLQMRFKALHNFTDKLPLVFPDDNENTELIGNTTRTAILSGVINGMSAEIDGIIERYKKRYETMKTVFTGGDYKYFDKRLKNSIFARSNFVAEGLLEILNFNEKN